jgi:uncharacterized metal-binding protein
MLEDVIGSYCEIGRRAVGGEAPLFSGIARHVVRIASINGWPDNPVTSQLATVLGHGISRSIA